MAALVFENVSKYFPRHAGQLLLRDRLNHLLQRNSRERFCALRGVTFTLDHGDTLGIVGHNGAGKSTLLNIATGLCRPTAGAVTSTGRIAALLELGSGFHPDLTGAENVRINAALLGLSRRMTDKRFDDIVDFSGIGDFIDEPLRTYSSGMIMRLAFSVAINVDPDILIVDEVLVVGDQAFFQKCFDKIMEFRHAGKTLVCVSHALEMLKQLCTIGLWLDHGQVVKEGSMEEVLDAYQGTVPSAVRASAAD